MSVHLHKEIEIVKSRILNLGIMVEEQLNRACEAILAQDVDLAREVIERDMEIDRKEMDIEEECLKTLALHQPVASDLRYMVGVLKINNDLERIGDLAVNIAEKLPYSSVGTKEPADAEEFDFKTMAEKTSALYRKSLDAMINQDSKLAEQICREDDEVDDLNQEAIQVCLRQIKQYPDLAELWLKKLAAARNLERIADHATNIAEDVIYMVRGEIARHHGEV